MTLLSESKPGLYVTIIIYVLLKKAIIFSRVMTAKGTLLFNRSCFSLYILSISFSAQWGNYFEKPEKPHDVDRYLNYEKTLVFIHNFLKCFILVALKSLLNKPFFYKSIH